MVSLKLYILSLMKDERDGLFGVLIKGLLHFLSLVYALAISFVDWSYRSGLRRQHKIGVPVVSIGNITLGGTGKTPFAVFLADHFLNAGKKPAVLIRGYGADESRMLRDELPDVPVFTGQDRVRSARLAVESGSDVLILDDAFQHRRIARDLNILMLDSVSLFGNGFLFPRGLLREPVSSIKRADIFVLTKTDRIGPQRRESIVRELGRLAPGKPVVQTRHRPLFLTDVTGAAYPAESLSGKKVCLASGIVDPGYFAFLMERAGAVIAARCDYTDHHRYRQLDIDTISAECARKNAEAVIFTKKDYVKIRELDTSRIEDKLFVLNVAIDITQGKENLVAGLNSIVSG
ncbi:MAG: tetraacyldisaccharide 4'-kinase [Candidatus Omnitrophota bacterium]